MEKRYDMICDSCGKLHSEDDETLRRDKYGSPLCSICEDWILTAIEEPVVLATEYDSLAAEVERLKALAYEPHGDNHHNALDCPYCSAKADERFTAAHERIKALEEIVVDARNERHKAFEQLDSVEKRNKALTDELRTVNENCRAWAKAENTESTCRMAFKWITNRIDAALSHTEEDRSRSNFSAIDISVRMDGRTDGIEEPDDAD